MRYSLAAMCQGGGLGGILGSLGGAALDVLVPEIGIPLSIATGLGGALGGTIGGLASGEKFGKALTGGLETGAISGALAGVGNVVGGGDFFGAPASGGIGGLFGSSGTGSTAATAGGTAAAPALASTGPSAAGITATPLSAPAAAGAGAGAGAPITGIGASVGSAPADITGALPTAGSTLGGVTAGAGAGGDALPATNTGGFFNRLFGGGSGGSGGGFFGNIFGGGSTPTGVAFDASGNQVPVGSADAVSGSVGGGGAAKSGISSLFGNVTGKDLLLAAPAAITLFQGQGQVPGLANLQNEAQTLSATGGPLAQSLASGQLPPGAQAAEDAATQAARAQVRSAFANLGISGSSQEASALASVDQNAAAQRYKDLLSATQTGLNTINAATPLYQTILSTQLARDQATQQAIARLAAALAGGTGSSAAA